MTRPLIPPFPTTHCGATMTRRSGNGSRRTYGAKSASSALASFKSLVSKRTPLAAETASVKEVPAGLRARYSATRYRLQCFSSSGTLPPFSASFAITCLCSQTFIVAESSVLPV